jgi:hypothetical protein
VLRLLRWPTFETERGSTLALDRARFNDTVEDAYSSAN